MDSRWRSSRRITAVALLAVSRGAGYFTRSRHGVSAPVQCRASCAGGPSARGLQEYAELDRREYRATKKISRSRSLEDRAAAMSARKFARVSIRQMATRRHAMSEQARIEVLELNVARPETSVEKIASRAGFSSAELLLSRLVPTFQDRAAGQYRQAIPHCRPQVAGTGRGSKRQLLADSPERACKQGFIGHRGLYLHRWLYYVARDTCLRGGPP